MDYFINNKQFNFSIRKIGIRESWEWRYWEEINDIIVDKVEECKSK